NGVGVIVDAVESDAFCAGHRTRGIEQIAQHDSFPTSVAHESGIESVADTHERRLLFDFGERLQVLESVASRGLHQSIDFQMPKIFIHPRIDHVLGHAIKQIVRRDRLYLTAFVVRAVITKRRRIIKFSEQANATAGNENAEAAEDQSATSDWWRKFRALSFTLRLREKMKTADEDTLENQNAEGESDQRGHSRRRNREPEITCAEHRPENNGQRDDRQRDKDRHRPRGGAP